MTNDDYFDGIRHDGYVNTKHFHYEQDFWLKAQKEAEQAEIKVVNHAYLIERLADYPETFWEIGCLSSMRLNNYFQSWKMLVRKV